MSRSTPAVASRIAALTAAALTSCARSAAAPAESGATRGAEVHREGMPVRVAEPKAARYRGRVSVSGDLRADQAALLGFAVGGRLERINVKRGQRVQAGQMLGALDAALARASLAQARAGVAAARAQLGLAADGLARTEAIRRKAGGVAEAQLFQAVSQRDLAAAQLAGAAAQAAQAKLSLGYHFLRAPFSGVVTQVPSGVGVAVGPGSPLFGLEATNTLVLDTSVAPAQALGLAVGAKVRVAVPATGAFADGAVRAVLPSADPAAHRVPVEIAVANANGALLPHVLARAELETGERPALEVPGTSLVQREGALSVFVLGEGSLARRIPVQLLAQEGDKSLVEVDGALERSRVVDLPPADLADGARLAPGGAP